MLQGRVIWDRSHMPDRGLPRTEQTSLVRFRDHWYCAFRESEMHYPHPSGRSRVVRSADGETWESAALFDWDGACVRDPYLSVTASAALLATVDLSDLPPPRSYA